MSLKKRIESFGFAFKGIANTWKGANFKIQFAMMIVALVLAYVLNFTTMEWVCILLVSAMVLSAEAFNTALEVFVDMVSPEYNRQAGKVKDIAAGAVLIVSLFAAIVGIVLYLPKIWSYVV